MGGQVADLERPCHVGRVFTYAGTWLQCEVREFRPQIVRALPENRRVTDDGRHRRQCRCRMYHQAMSYGQHIAGNFPTVRRETGLLHGDDRTLH